MRIDKSYFWTDSEIVLKYIANDSRRFHIFVANRVSLIRELSSPDQWRYIESKANPADFITRGQSTVHERWFNGAEILRKYKSEWEIENKSNFLAEDDPEVRQNLACGAVAIDDCSLSGRLCEAAPDNPLDRLSNHFSSWYGMKRALAWLLRYVKYLRGDKSKARLSVNEVVHAGKILILRSQSQSFPLEVANLRQSQSVKASSSLRMLHPFLDNEGLLRVGGRLHDADVKNKHPYILSSKHAITTAIIYDIHKIAHVGVEWVLSLVRKDFWVIRGRPLIKRILKSCVVCKRLYGKPCEQLMADLPKERLESNRPPFTSVGIDVFGPFYVKVGRSEVKRYGCLFTCLNIRAVHIEKLSSLDTDSFLNGFRRFCSRRGHPEVVYSDQGTNFIGGKAELKSSMSELSQKFIDSYAVKHDLVWHFNPPTASHMGGLWERMIGIIKRILLAILPNTVKLTDEILETVFCEAESIVNSRPLTKVSDDPRDCKPLTPNDLLLLRSNNAAPPGKFDKSDMYHRRWRHVQHLANQFWSKWLKLYLP